ncbi:MAG: hypothetical protein P8N52_08480 [Crocinitomicaceae bacterium]|nr:hypothetical protein [Crocinitomicaceae bacterium]MDG1776978.1 hypothetical protein [Crocinitomicaceae bacterium]
MNKVVTVIIACILVLNAFGQMNMKDSTAQVIGYWNLGDTEHYKVSLQKVRLKKADTVVNELMTYNVDVTIIDSTANSYSIEWFYHDYKTNSSNELIKKITSLSDDLKVVIETDEFGAIKAVKNWKEVSVYLKESINQFKSDLNGVPSLEKLLQQIEEMYSSKYAIESAAIRDIQQFYTYHGGKYVLDEHLEFGLQLPNVYSPEKPLNSKVILSLDELDVKDNSYVLRSSQEVDSDELTTTTFEYLKQLAKTMKTKPPKKEDIGTLTNLTTTASRIHDTGWLIYSVQTKVVSTKGVTNSEIRIIEID